jgi:RimJ/RimL family protein N-acetyltransferase
MAVNVFIREADSKDARQIADVHVRSWQAAYRGLIPDEELANLSVDEREHFWSQILSRGQRSNLVLLDQDVVVGWTAFGAARDPDCDSTQVYELYGIYLLSNYWDTGCGRQLYQATEQRISSLAALEIVLWVFEKNIRARRFYEAAGFRIEAEKQKHISIRGATLAEVRYRKKLGHS